MRLLIREMYINSTRSEKPTCESKHEIMTRGKVRVLGQKKKNLEIKRKSRKFGSFTGNMKALNNKLANLTSTRVEMKSMGGFGSDRQINS